MAAEWAPEQSFLVPYLGKQRSGALVVDTMMPENVQAIQSMQDDFFVVTSLSEGADDLNDGNLKCEEGICIVQVQEGLSLSNLRHHCLFRSDRIEEAHRIFEKEMSTDMKDKVTKLKYVKNAHNFQKKTFVAPTWCDNCGGILVGGGYQCYGPCGMRCHKGLGKGCENCFADMLLTPCNPGSERKEGNRSFSISSAIKQIGRNIHQDIKDVVVKETMKEQRAWGKFAALKEQMEELRSCWDDDIVTFYVVLWQLATIMITACGANALVSWFNYRFPDRAYGRLIAATDVSIVLFVETLLILATYIFAREMLIYSELIHRFVDTILQIDLEEVEINLDDAALALMRVSYRLLFFSTAAWVGALAAWIWALNCAD